MNRAVAHRHQALSGTEDLQPRGSPGHTRADGPERSGRLFPGRSARAIVGCDRLQPVCWPRGYDGVHRRSAMTTIDAEVVRPGPPGARASGARSSTVAFVPIGDSARSRSSSRRPPPRWPGWSPAMRRWWTTPCDPPVAHCRPGGHCRGVSAGAYLTAGRRSHPCERRRTGRARLPRERQAPARRAGQRRCVQLQLF